MSHPFRAPSVAGVVALLVAAPLAAADPLPLSPPVSGWAYSATVRTATGRGVLDLGTHRLEVDPSGNGTADPVISDYAITAPLLEATVSESFPIYPNEPNDLSVRLFSVGQGYSVVPVADAPASDRTFLLAFTLTDLASGQSRTLEYTGIGGVATTGMFGRGVLFSASLDPTTTELTLGGNRYRLTTIGGLPDEIDEPATVGVRVETLATTPEPGTLALAGLGLGAVGLRRWRKWFGRRH